MCHDIEQDVNDLVIDLTITHCARSVSTRNTKVYIIKLCCENRELNE
jgi:hypothetical protein